MFAVNLKLLSCRQLLLLDHSLYSHPLFVLVLYFIILFVIVLFVAVFVGLGILPKPALNSSVTHKGRSLVVIKCYRHSPSRVTFWVDKLSDATCACFYASLLRIHCERSKRAFCVLCAPTPVMLSRFPVRVGITAQDASVCF